MFHPVSLVDGGLQARSQGYLQVDRRTSNEIDDGGPQEPRPVSN
jgi:hypothetical protein